MLEKGNNPRENKTFHKMFVFTGLKKNVKNVLVENNLP